MAPTGESVPAAAATARALEVCLLACIAVGAAQDGAAGAGAVATAGVVARIATNARTQPKGVEPQRLWTL